MKIKINKFQEGGAAPAQAPAGAELDPMAVLIQGAQLALEGQDCETAMQVCQMLLEMAGNGAPAGGAPEEAAPAPAEGEPVYRKGGRLVKRINN